MRWLLRQAEVLVRALEDRRLTDLLVL